MVFDHSLMRLPEEDLNHVIAHTEPLWEAFRNSDVFITGGTGFVGTWLVESFLRANERFGLNATAHVLTRGARAGRPGLHYLKGDVRAFDFPDGEFPFVIHAATEQVVDPTPDQPLAAFTRDIDGTLRVLELARSRNARRLLFTSSGAVYGLQPPALARTPEDYPGAPPTTATNTAYGQAKRASEFACAMYARQYGFSALIARLFAFLGPGLPFNAQFAAGNFIRDALGTGPIRIAGDGTPYRSYLYAADLAIWLWTILARGESARPYNVGSPDALTIAELARRVVAVIDPGRPIEIAQTPAPGAAPARYVPDTTRAECELGLRPLIGLEEGIRRTARFAGDHS